MCGISWQHELGETDVRVFETPSALEKFHKPMDCGIVECEVTLKRWVKKQTI